MRVVRVVVRDIAGELLTSPGVEQHDRLLETEVDGVLPVAGGAFQRPQDAGQRNERVGPCLGEQVLVVSRNLTAATECGASQALGPDPQVVGDMAGV